MPLVKGKAAKTRKGFGENVKEEMKKHPQKQAVAIAYSEARGGKKKSSAKNSMSMKDKHEEMHGMKPSRKGMK